MSAECRKCGFDLDGDFGCPNCERQTLKFEYQTAKRQAAENGEAYSLCKQECDALKAENEQLRIQFKRADLFGLEAILESEQLFKRSCEKLKIENDEARAAHKYELGCQQSIALKLQAQVSGLKDALEFIGCQGFRAKREECTCTRCKALAALKAQRGRDD